MISKIVCCFLRQDCCTGCRWFCLSESFFSFFKNSLHLHLASFIDRKILPDWGLCASIQMRWDSIAFDFKRAASFDYQNLRVFTDIEGTIGSAHSLSVIASLRYHLSMSSLFCLAFALHNRQSPSKQIMCIHGKLMVCNMGHYFQ